MKGDKLPASDHIARLCMPKSCADGEIQASAFILRKDELSLSVNWLEFLKCPTRESEIVAICEVYKKKFNRVPTNAKIAILNIDKTCSHVHDASEDNRILNILHEPEEKDPSHSGIFGMNQDDPLIAELICEMIQENYPAKI